MHNTYQFNLLAYIMTYSHLKIGFIILSLFVSPVVFAQMGENQAPAPQPEPVVVEPAPTAQTAATRTAAPSPTQVGIGIDATTATNTPTAEPAASQTFVQKIFAPIRTLFYRVTDALGITSATNRVSRESSASTKNENPGRHARVYMRQSGGTGSRLETGTGTDVMKQTTDTSPSVNLTR